MIQPQNIPGAGYLNPTLEVQAYFMVPVSGGDMKRTQFKLQNHPEVATWLLSFVDYYLSRQGRIQGEHRIAPPPEGRTREELITGGVILTRQNPDGSVGMKLNSAMEMGLYIRARRHGQPALDTHTALGVDPELSKWLLNRYINGQQHGPLPGSADNLAASLRRYAILVDELPAAEVHFPDPAVAVDLAEELACMSQIYLQEAGAPIPAPVRETLGEHTPALPPGSAIIWGRDAGTGMVYPVCWDGKGSRQELEKLAGREAAQRAAQWEKLRETARETLRTRNYATLPGILPPAQRESLRRYVRQLMDHGYFPDLGVGDTQVELRRSIHKEPTIAALHQGLTGLVADICGQDLLGSFCQLGVYEEGAVLEKHTDRSQCLRNMSFIFDMSGPGGEPEPWPLYFEIDGKPVAVMLKAGDGTVYCGTQTPHWRDALPAGLKAVAAFYFWVSPDFKGTLN